MALAPGRHTPFEGDVRTIQYPARLASLPWVKPAPKKETGPTRSSWLFFLIGVYVICCRNVPSADQGVQSPSLYHAWVVAVGISACTVKVLHVARQLRMGREKAWIKLLSPCSSRPPSSQVVRSTRCGLNIASPWTNFFQHTRERKRPREGRDRKT